MITNNVDFYNYMRDRGVWCTYMLKPPTDFKTDELVIAFPDTHNMTVCGNRFNAKKVEEYRKECSDMIDWMQCSSRVIVVTPVIKFDSAYMKKHAWVEYNLLQQINYKKQIIHTKNIGSLLVPHRLQLRYIGIEPIKFDEVNTDNIKDPMYYYYPNKRQQLHYMNVINMSNDTLERRKLRYIPEYALFSQLYKKLIRNISY